MANQEGLHLQQHLLGDLRMSFCLFLHAFDYQILYDQLQNTQYGIFYKFLAVFLI